MRIFLTFLFLCASIRTSAQTQEILEGSPAFKGYKTATLSSWIYHTRYKDSGRSQQVIKFDDNGHVVERIVYSGGMQTSRVVSRYAADRLVERTTYGRPISVSTPDGEDSSYFDVAAMADRQVTTYGLHTIRTDYYTADADGLRHDFYELILLDSIRRPVCKYSIEIPDSSISYSQMDATGKFIGYSHTDTVVSSYAYSDSMIVVRHSHGRYFKSKVTSKMDAAGRTVLETYRSRDGIIRDEQSFVYDTAGKLTKWRRLKGEEPPGLYTFDRIDYSYDNEGKRTLEREFRKGQLVGETGWEYKR